MLVVTTAEFSSTQFAFGKLQVHCPVRKTFINFGWRKKKKSNFYSLIRGLILSQGRAQTNNATELSPPHRGPPLLLRAGCIPHAELASLSWTEQDDGN